MVNVDQRGEEGVYVAEVVERDLDLVVVGELARHYARDHS